MRIEVSPGVPQRLDAAVQEFGSTNISVVSRLLLWFVEQDEMMQASVLGLIPADSRVDITRRAIEAMAKKQRP